MNVNWRWKSPWKKKELLPQNPNNTSFLKPLWKPFLHRSSSVNQRHPLMPVIPSSFFIRRYLGYGGDHRYSFCASLTEYRVWLWHGERRGVCLCPKSRSKTSIHLNLILKQYFFCVQLSYSLMLIYRVNLSWMIQSLLYISALPKRGKAQQKDLAPKFVFVLSDSLFFFSFFSLLAHLVVDHFAPWKDH